MVLSHRVVFRWIVPVVAAGWSGALILAGMWVILEAATRWPILYVPLVAGGTSLLSAGNVVFLAGVADRLFPNARLAIVEWLEIISCLMFFLSSVACLVTLAFA